MVTALSLKSKMTLAVSLLVSVILILVAGITESFWRTELEKTIATQQNALASASARQLDDKLFSAQEQLTHFSRRIDRGVLQSPERFNAVMDQEDDVSHLFNGGLLLISTTGKVLAEYPSSPEHIGSDRSGREYFRQTIASGMPVISFPYISTTLKKATIAFTVPVFGGDGSMAAILVGRHGLDSGLIFASLRDLKIGNSGYLFIFDNGRDMVLHPDSKRIMEVIPVGIDPGVERALKGFEGTLENVNSRGVKGLTSFKHLKATDWILGAHIPLAEAYAPLQRGRGVFLALLAGGVLLSIVISNLVMGCLMAPLLALTTHVQDFFTRQGARQQFPVTGTDEVGRLGQAFNTLLENLAEQNRAIQAGAEVYRIVAEFTSELALWRTPDGSIRYISPNCKELTGYLDTEFYAEPGLLDTLIHPDDEEQWQHHRETGGDSLAHSEVTLRLIGRSGETRWFSHFCHEVSDKGGQPLGVRGSFIDITERKRMQQLLEDEKKFFERIIQNAVAPMFVLDRNHTILFWNNALAKLTGMSSFQMVGTKQQWKAFYPTKRPVLADLVIDQKLQSINEYYATFDSSTFTDGAYRAEGWYDHLGGKRRYIFFEVAPIRNRRNEIVAAIETVEEITDLKLAQEALTASQMQLMAKHQEMEVVFAQVDMAKREWEETLDSLKDFVILTDGEHRVRRCNRLLCDMTGKEFKDVLGRDWRDLLTESGFAFTSFDDNRGELAHDRSKRLYDLNIYPMKEPETEQVSGLVVSLNDTTEIRAVTEELQRTSRELNESQHKVFQQEKMASIGQLAAGVAHEINNPMGFISSNLSTLNKYLERFREFIAAQDQVVATVAHGEDIDRMNALRRKLKIDLILDDTRQLIAESQDGAGRVRRIVQDLKSFSRVDQAECSFVDIIECLESTINVAWNEIKYVAVLNRDFGTVPQIKCFPQQLNQVFLNLLVNAAQAMQEQGEITVRTWSEQDNVFVSVRDTGTGIPPEVAKRIFEPFFTTKDVGKGTGLGLSISYDIIRKHNGDISVESEAGAGTTFTVRLPVEGSAG